MKTSLVFCLPVAVIFLLFSSCQKEIHFEFISEGLLIKDVNNNCEMTIKGNYTIGKSLDGNDYAEVKVHVTAKGTYSIGTDTVNNYSFYASGNFKDTGIVLVKLKGHGKPVNEGSDKFNVVYGRSNCQFINKVNGGTNASFTLQGDSNSCMIDSALGVYVKGWLLDTNNKVTIVVNVSNMGGLMEFLPIR